MKGDVSLAEILGAENEYDLLNKSAKVCINQHNDEAWRPLQAITI